MAVLVHWCRHLWSNSLCLLQHFLHLRSHNLVRDFRLRILEESLVVKTSSLQDWHSEHLLQQVGVLEVDFLCFLVVQSDRLCLILYPWKCILRWEWLLFWDLGLWQFDFRCTCHRVKHESAHLLLPSLRRHHLPCSRQHSALHHLLHPTFARLPRIGYLWHLLHAHGGALNLLRADALYIYVRTDWLWLNLLEYVHQCLVFESLEEAQ